MEESKSIASGSNITRWEREDPDVQLMLKFKGGDESAFEELVRRNTGKVHGLIYRFMGRDSMVEDLTQEVFMRIHRTAARYEPAAKFTTWLYRIVANLCFNAMRSRKRGFARQLSAPDGQDSDTIFQGLPDHRHPKPTEQLVAAELRDKIAAAIETLPENQKIAIILSQYENKSYKNIADILDCSDMAVKSLISRARRHLRKILV